MGLPVACVEVGVTDEIPTMEHPAVTYIDAHMGNPRSVVGSREKYQVTGLRAACPGGDVV